MTKADFITFRTLIESAEVLYAEHTEEAYDALDEGEILDAFSVLACLSDHLYDTIQDLADLIDPPF